MPEYVTTKQAAEATGIDQNAVRRWCRLGLMSGAHKNDNGEWCLTMQALRRYREAISYKTNELSVTEAAKIAGVGESAVRTWCVEGLVKASKPAKTWKINRDSLIDFATPPEGYLTYPEVAEKYHYSNTGISYLARTGAIKSINDWHGRHLYFEPDIIAHASREGYRVRESRRVKAREWFIEYYQGEIPDQVPNAVTLQCAEEFGLHRDTAAHALACARRKLGIDIKSKARPLKAWMLEHVYIWSSITKICEEVEGKFKRFKVSRSVIKRVITDLRNEVRRTEHEVITNKYDHRSKKQQYDKNRI